MPRLKALKHEYTDRDALVARLDIEYNADQYGPNMEQIQRLWHELIASLQSCKTLDDES